MYIQLGRYPEAMEALKQSIALRPTLRHTGTWRRFTFTCAAIRIRPRACEQALKIDPKDWLNWGDLGTRCFRFRRAARRRRAAYQKAIELVEADGWR